MEINIDFKDKKPELIKFYRDLATEHLENNISGLGNHKKKAESMNRKIQTIRNDINYQIVNIGWTKSEQLNSILLNNYVSYIVMLEFRNKVWPYEYMAFSRRIGELWEPFCKLPFDYPVTSLELYEPPKFSKVKNSLRKEIREFVGDLSLDQNKKAQLKKYFDTVFSLVESGGIKLDLDLHFKQNGVFYDVDYKSGFSSNEKGNTNRLLLVASIYNSLQEEHKNIMFVRQKEEDNNHYLQTLKNSPYWEVYCADEAYDKIKEFTGFNIKKWMNDNMQWDDDISQEFKEYLSRNDLLKYLTW